ncbi:DUF1253-domain-containing protein [Suhomyces tanzawaensis NRRL Y-17324]|uniref:U3 small nucleolar RNA-associated protein 25 n=1 Tax=Suhomyces tanzawaensis NRRL Y-17324 TaxID=984487 RepID=A0A1E4SP86_9ASCO|nr:DUF1253-domain-containing protein [Suhomyces tanzawaensis NRRL Y-17324]ODV81227.1 DUF1253-domain-containing protein [Suhomyces tanzawaensis NRRL Y-17324]
MARQKRRSTHAAAEVDPESAPKRARQKHGRQQLRTVTRTARRGDALAAQSENYDNTGDIEASDLNESGDEEVEQEKDTGMAYNALLTLLKSDHQSKTTKTKSNKKQNVVKTEGSSDEKDDEEFSNEELAGVNMNAEEDEEEEVDEEEEEEDEDETNTIQKNPFEAHFNLVTDEYIEEQEKLVVKQNEKWTLSALSKVSNSDYSILSSLPPGKPVATPIDPGSVKNVKDLRLKNRVLEAYEKKYSDNKLNALDLHLASSMFNYKDVCYSYQSFKNDTHRKLYAMHALNHVFNTRDRILKNTAKLKGNREDKLSDEGASALGPEEELELRDQGFTRPKVLILLPTRNACFELVEQLIQLSGSEQQENKKKFTQQFYSDSVTPGNKPDDFKYSFKGNNNDFFCIGIKFTRKTLKLYSSFYSSDIIIASPIGLSMILENPDKKKRQYDFLSSIEVLIIDRANQIEMQNWDHVLTVFKYINKIPKEFHDADFSRIRMWYINDQSKLLRQTLVFSEYLTPNINNILGVKKSINVAGKMKYRPIMDSTNCIMNSIGIKIKQIFQRFDSEINPLQDAELRFKYFINTTLPSLMKSSSYSNGIMIFIPSYYDYLRIKHHMKTSTKFLFGSLDEYSSQSKLDRVRRAFHDGKIKILLYTERLHYFRRFEINGVKTMLMYGLPSNPLFYKELVRFIGKSVYREEVDLDLALVKVLYSKLDVVTLERVVGAERARVLCGGVNELYEFR